MQIDIFYLNAYMYLLYAGMTQDGNLITKVVNWLLLANCRGYNNILNILILAYIVKNAKR